MNDSNYTHTCQVCNEQYKPKLKKDGTPHKRKYNSCSSSCRDKARSIAGKIKPQVKRVRQCIVACCESNVLSGGYCSRHYKQVRESGEIDDRHDMFRFMKSLAVLSCPVCLNVFTGESRAMNKRVTCSMVCMAKMYAQNRNPSGAYTNVYRKCISCNKDFKRAINSKSTGQYCSRDCSSAVNLADKRTESQKHSQALVSKEVQAIRKIRNNVIRYFYKKNVKSQIDSLRRIRIRRLTVKKVIGLCDCGSKFIRMRMDHKYGGSYSVCNPCRNIAEIKAKRKARRTSKTVRRARMSNAGVVERVDPIDVLNAFNWTCYICKKKTPKKLRGTYDDRAPEVDHIVPLSKGGNHTFANLACACRKCNGVKNYD